MSADSALASAPHGVVGILQPVTLSRAPTHIAPCPQDAPLHLTPPDIPTHEQTIRPSSTLSSNHPLLIAPFPSGYSTQRVRWTRHDPSSHSPYSRMSFCVTSINSDIFRAQPEDNYYIRQALSMVLSPPCYSVASSILACVAREVVAAARYYGCDSTVQYTRHASGRPRPTLGRYPALAVLKCKGMHEE